MRCVYCNKLNDKYKELSFHSFPKDEMWKIWVRNMGRTDWTPKKWQKLCAEHFEENCFDVTGFRKTLKKGFVPTLFQHNKGNVPTPADLKPIIHVNKQIKLHRSLHEQGGKEKDSLSTSPMEVEGQHETLSLPWSEAISHDHTYAESANVTRRKLESTRMKVLKLTRDNNVFRQRTRRYQEKIQKFKECIIALREAEDLSTDDTENLH